MTIGERLRQANRDNNMKEVTKIITFLQDGSIRRGGEELRVSKAQVQRFFVYCDATITEERFEELWAAAVVGPS